MTTPTLPIATRDLTVTPLKDAEIKLILDFLNTNASGTAVNFVTGIGTIAPTFFAGLQAYLENRRTLMSEMSYGISYPKPVLKDQYGNNSVILDNL